MMEIGKSYKRYRKNEYTGEFEEDTFPFREKVGVYLGTVKSGWLHFKLSVGKDCIMNGGNYEEEGHSKPIFIEETQNGERGEEKHDRGVEKPTNKKGVIQKG